MSVPGRTVTQRRVARRVFRFGIIATIIGIVDMIVDGIEKVSLAWWVAYVNRVLVDVSTVLLR
jgi:hypothetical protein